VEPHEAVVSLLRRSRHARRLRRDDGISLVEFSFVAPVFFLLVFGIIEFGLVFRDYITVNDAVNDAARSGAIAGPDWGALDDDPPPTSGSPANLPNATGDFVTIKRLRQGLGIIPVEWIERIVIFKAGDPSFGSPEDQLSQACKEGTGSSGSGPNSDPNLAYVGACNVYDAEEAFRAYAAKDVDYFNCVEDAASPECNWPSRARVNDPVNPTARPTYLGPDYLGVYVEIERPYLTGVFGSSLNIQDAAIVRLEPGLETG
jgi:hypothetical protein